MKARYTPRAVADLAGIADYIRQFSHAGAPRVRDEIPRTIEMLKRFPYSGSRTNTEPARKVVVRRYPHIVYYVVDAERRELVIVTIQHGAQSQPFESDG